MEGAHSSEPQKAYLTVSLLLWYSRGYTLFCLASRLATVVIEADQILNFGSGCLSFSGF